jgi:hypothetical protein
MFGNADERVAAPAFAGSALERPAAWTPGSARTRPRSCSKDAIFCAGSL